MLPMHPLNKPLPLLIFLYFLDYTQEEAEEALDKFCEVLGSLKEECQTMVNTFFPQIWDMVINELVR